MAVLAQITPGYGFERLGSMSTLGLIGLGACLILLYQILKVLYRLFLHPLSKYPGPKLAAATTLWYNYHILKGTAVYEVRRLHLIHGPVLRVSPDAMTYASPKSWDDIYGFRSGKAEMSKDPVFYSNDKVIPSIGDASKEKHMFLRKLMSRGFSEAALREQEPIIKGYIDLFIKRLHEQSKISDGIDMVSWYNFLTFDIIGDLAFGEPFGCLDTSAYHMWVKLIFEFVRFGNIYQVLCRYPVIKFLASLIPAPKALVEKSTAHNALTREKVLRRQASKVDRADFVSNLFKPSNNLSELELIGNSSVIILAGSETTGTTLAGVTYFLGKHPEVKKKLVEEIRSTFSSADEINFLAVNKLKYLLACLQESLRMFPPAAGSLPRVVPKGGDYIDGNWTPEGTTVSVVQLAVNYHPANWVRPNEFLPERWLGDEEFANDKKNAMQPFSVGPRNCIGKNLAYVEMRVVLARLLWEFDMELSDEVQDWEDTPIYIIFDKKPLPVKLTPVVRA